jgi:hypothetical protein
MSSSARVLGAAGEDVGEPSLRAEVVHLGGDDQAVHDGGALAAAVGTGEQPGVSAVSNAAQCAIGGAAGSPSPVITAGTNGRRLTHHGLAPPLVRSSWSRPRSLVAAARHPARLPAATDTVLARLAALKTTSTPDLKRQWRELFETEPPPYNRRFLESRLAYRIQELAYGGLKPATIERLEALGEQLDGGNRQKRQQRGNDRPIAGTQLIREWQGIEHCVTVRDDGFEYQGRPYKSLSAIARAITGTRWNGWLFFGLKNHRSAA